MKQNRAERRLIKKFALRGEDYQPDESGFPPQAAISRVHLWRGLHCG